MLPDSGEGQAAPLVALLPEGDERRNAWWRRRLGQVEALNDVELLARRLARMQEEGFRPWLLKDALEDLGRALERLDAARAQPPGGG